MGPVLGTVWVVADGDPRSPHTNSGVAKGLSDALARDSRVKRVRFIDGKLGPAGRAVARALSFRPSRRAWNEQYLWGAARINVRSWKRDLHLAVGRAKNDIVIHVRNLYRPSKVPYVTFIDTTVDQRQNNWAERALSPALHAARRDIEQKFFQRAVLVATAGAYVAREVKSRHSVRRVISAGGGLNFLPTIDADLAVNDGTSSTSLRLLVVGKDFARKGGGDLLRAVADLRERDLDVELHVVGPVTIPDQEGVTNHGFVDSREQLAHLYAQADVFCLPATFEPYGLAVLEAMHSGKPVVVSNVGVLPEFVESGVNGFVVPAGDPDALAQAIEILAEDSALRSSMGAAGRERAAAYSWGAVVSRILDELTPTSGDT